MPEAKGGYILAQIMKVVLNAEQNMHDLSSRGVSLSGLVIILDFTSILHISLQ